MKSELKPCPFCGSEARLTYSTDNHRQPYVTCDTPKCPSCNPYQWHYHTEEEAIEAWNRRADDPEEAYNRGYSRGYANAKDDDEVARRWDESFRASQMPWNRGYTEMGG